MAAKGSRPTKLSSIQKCPRFQGNPVGVSRTSVIRKADAGDLPCVIVNRGTRQKMRRFPRALIEDLAARGGLGAETDIGHYAASWRATAARTVSTLTLLSRGVAHVIDQGLVWSCFTWWCPLLSTRRAGRVVSVGGSWVRS
jgi:hypothetical protein